MFHQSQLPNPAPLREHRPLLADSMDTVLQYRQGRIYRRLVDVTAAAVTLIPGRRTSADLGD
jgi:hypothetical protein